MKIASHFSKHWFSFVLVCFVCTFFAGWCQFVAADCDRHCVLEVGEGGDQLPAVKEFNLQSITSPTPPRIYLISTLQEPPQPQTVTQSLLSALRRIEQHLTRPLLLAWHFFKYLRFLWSLPLPPICPSPRCFSPFHFFPISSAVKWQAEGWLKIALDCRLRTGLARLEVDTAR